MKMSWVFAGWLLVARFEVAVIASTLESKIATCTMWIIQQKSSRLKSASSHSSVASRLSSCGHLVQSLASRLWSVHVGSKPLIATPKREYTWGAPPG
jgi:hypothetical protein